MANLSAIIAEWQCLTRDALVERLVEEKNIEELTSIKLKLYDKCKEIKDFPRGEFYSRRKPKGSSNFSSLEERLADDVYELMNCLDTGIVTSEVKALIKPCSTTSVVDGNNEVNHGPANCINNVNDVPPSPNIANRSLSGWSELKSKVSSMESDQMLFRERVPSEIMELKVKVTELDSTIQAQNAEIKQLKSENERLLCMHASSNNSISCNDKSTTTSQQPIDHVAWDKNLIMENEDTNNNDIIVQDEPNVPLSKELSSYRSAVVSRKTNEVSDHRSNKEPSQMQGTIKASEPKRNNIRCPSTVSPHDEFIGV